MAAGYGCRLKNNEIALDAKKLRIADNFVSKKSLNVLFVFKMRISRKSYYGY